MANCSSARFAVLNCVVSGVTCCDRLPIGFGVVEDTSGQTSCILDQLVVIFGANAVDDLGNC